MRSGPTANLWGLRPEVVVHRRLKFILVVEMGVDGWRSGILGESGSISAEEGGVAQMIWRHIRNF